MATIDSESDVFKHTQPSDWSPKRRRGSLVPKQGQQRSKYAAPAGYVTNTLNRSVAERHFVILVPFAMIIGIILYRMASFEPNFYVVAVSCLICCGFAILRNINRASYFLILISAILVGFTLMSAKSSFWGTRMLERPLVLDAFEGNVADVLKISDDSISLKIAVANSADNKRLKNIRYVRLTIREKHLPDLSRVQIGDEVRLRARFAPVPKPIVPDGYDAGFQSYFDGIGAYGISLGEVELSPSTQFSFIRSIEILRQAIGARIDAAMEPMNAGIARALIIGDQTKIDDLLRDRIAVAGLAHVLAISGLHLTLVVGTVLVGARALFSVTPLPDRWVRPVALLFATFVALSYLAVSGANLATQRATLMLLLAFGALLVARRAVTMRNVAIAATLILVAFPHEVFKPGFQLSFAAVLGLVAAYSEMRQPKIEWPKWTKWVGGLAVTSLIAGLATAPIAAYHFQQFAPLGLIGNLIVVPIVGLWVLPFGFFAVLLMPFGLEQVMFTIMALGIDIVVWVANMVADASGHLSKTPVYAPWTLFGALLSLAWLAFIKGWMKLVVPMSFLLLFAGFGAQKPPTILVSDTTQGVMLNMDGQLYALGRKTKSFTYDVWSERFGAGSENIAVVGDCDKSGCSASTVDLSISLVKDRAALHEDCGRVDIIIAKFRGKVACSLGTIITQDQLEQFGVAALYAEPNKGWSIIWSAPNIKRPWR